MEMGTSPASVPVWTMGDRLRKAREAAGYGQQEFAERTSLARATISAAENGRRVPSRSNLRLWAVAAGVPYEWLLTGEVPGSDAGDVGEPCRRAPVPSRRPSALRATRAVAAA